MVQSRELVALAFFKKFALVATKGKGEEMSRKTDLPRAASSGEQ